MQIESSRPAGIAKFFQGKTPEQLLQTVALIFPLCGTAQSYCALQACRQALNLAADPATLAVQRWLVDLETVKEHALRVLLDWPRFLGEPADGPAARQIATALPRCRSAWFGSAAAFALTSRAAADLDTVDDSIAQVHDALSEAVFGVAPSNWLDTAPHRTALQSWAERGTTGAARLLRLVLERDWQAIGSDDLPHLPALAEADLAKRLNKADAAEFCVMPDWQGQACETTCLSRRRETPLVADLQRQFGKGLLTRLAARLVELATLAARLKPGQNLAPVQPAPLPARMGIGQVEAARGRLIHALTLDRGRVARYHLVAPTEWNFHPQGPAARALAALPQGADRRRQAELLINAIDPCVAYDLRIDP